GARSGPRRSAGRAPRPARRDAPPLTKATPQERTPGSAIGGRGLATAVSNGGRGGRPRSTARVRNGDSGGGGSSGSRSTGSGTRSARIGSSGTGSSGGGDAA